MSVVVGCWDEAKNGDTAVMKGRSVIFTGDMSWWKKRAAAGVLLQSMG